jgi:hypothetical protein
VKGEIVMNSAVVIQGILKSDGSLELQEKVNLPPGRVQVMVTPLPELPKADPFWQMMQRIWEGQKARGHVPRSSEEVEAERRTLREDWEERMRMIEHIQSEARKFNGLRPCRRVSRAVSRNLVGKLSSTMHHREDFHTISPYTVDNAIRLFDQFPDRLVCVFRPVGS